MPDERLRRPRSPASSAAAEPAAPAPPLCAQAGPAIDIRACRARASPARGRDRARYHARAVRRQSAALSGLPQGCNGRPLTIVRATFAGRGPAQKELLFHVCHPGLCAEPGGGGGIDIVQMLLPFVLIFIIMYFLILRPQRQQAKRREEMLKAIRRGDTVVTNGGIIGKVTKVVDDSEVELQIADGVKVRALRSLIAEVRAKAEPVAGNSPEESCLRCFISSAGRSRSSCWSARRHHRDHPELLLRRDRCLVAVVPAEAADGARPRSARRRAPAARGRSRQPGRGPRRYAGRRHPADAARRPHQLPRPRRARRDRDAEPRATRPTRRSRDDGA